MAREKALTVQRTIYMTPEMWSYLEQLARKRGRDGNASDLIREAIRLYIDSQAEVMGSRRHFQKSLQERIDLLEEHLNVIAMRNTQLIVFYAHVLIHLLAFGLAHLLAQLTRKEITAQQLIQKAVIEARREEAIFTEQIHSIREMSVPDKS